MVLPFRLLQAAADAEVSLRGCTLAAVAAERFLFVPTRGGLPSSEETWIRCPAAPTCSATMSSYAFVSSPSSSSLTSSASSSESVQMFNPSPSSSLSLSLSSPSLLSYFSSSRLFRTVPGLFFQGTEEQASGMVMPKDLKTSFIVLCAMLLGNTGNIFSCLSFLVSRAGQLLLTRWKPRAFLSFVLYLHNRQ
jgi:hypothetical protein